MEFTVERDGFHGALYRPAADRFPGKALIAFSGSDGRFPLACKLAEIFRGAGLTTLALAYWNAPGLPKQIAALPVEAVERPALWLRSRGCEKVGLWGISKGGELALLAASLMPELISCVVAVSPMDMVCQAIDPGKKKPLPGSSWSWRGAQLPYAPFDWSPGRVARDTLRAREPTLRPAYETAAARPPEDARIPVERIAGPVLLLSPGTTPYGPPPRRRSGWSPGWTPPPSPTPTGTSAMSTPATCCCRCGCPPTGFSP